MEVIEVKKIVEIALNAGEILLVNGAETYRVEETIEKICNSYGVSCECISLATGIFIAAKHENNELVSSLKRIKQRRVDLYRIELINSFSRNLSLKPISYDEAMKTLKEIEAAPYFSYKVRTFAACMTAFIYTLFFQGSFYDSLVAFFVSGITYVMLEKISEVGFFQFFEYYLAGFFIGSVSMFAEVVIPGINKSNVITGAIMILLPGVALTNGIKDALYGDFTSGLAKFGEAMLVITAVGAGIGTSLAIGLKWM
jgi:uncharacterized membrane protein YjjP (DUF1212 family)